MGADYILLLNNDTVITQNFLPRLISDDIDIISPTVKFKEQKNLIYDYGGFVNWWTGRTTHVNRTSPHKSSVIPVDYVSGCCMLVKRKVFEKIGLLPEDYFFYFEDVDFCTTAIKKGFMVAVDPGTLIFHKMSGSIKRWSSQAIYRNLTGNFIFITRHLGLRAVTGYIYLTLLTAKIIKDRLILKGQ